MKRRIRSAESVKIIVGAGQTKLDTWFSTNLDILDITSSYDWQSLFELESIDRILAEHVWEHLRETESEKALTECYRYMKQSGKMRIAVPDGFHPDPAYIEYVRPGGKGVGSENHKVLYNYKLLTKKLRYSGFSVELLEYWDENGQFHFNDWAPEDGHVLRSKRFDPRNRNGALVYTSLIADAIKR